MSGFIGIGYGDSSICKFTENANFARCNAYESNEDAILYWKFEY